MTHHPKLISATLRPAARRASEDYRLRLLAAFAATLTAAVLSISGAHAGGVGSTCGSRGLKPCSAGLFCDFPVSAKCGAADHPGQCAARPQICTREYRPVCGCDGKTYGNDCERRDAGIAKLHDGAC